MLLQSPTTSLGDHSIFKCGKRYVKFVSLAPWLVDSSTTLSKVEGSGGRNTRNTKDYR